MCVCLTPKNVAFLKHAIMRESEQLLSLILSNGQTFSAKSLPQQEGPGGHEKLKVRGSWSEERETKERKGIPPVNHMRWRQKGARDGQRGEREIKL